MQVKVLGRGCAKCQKLYAEAEQAIASSGVEAELVYVTELDDIMAYGVMSTPALVIDEEVKSSGRVVRHEEIAGWLVAAPRS